ncbi:MAG: exosortase-associated EpsI family protein [Pirellulales bacterium]
MFRYVPIALAFVLIVSLGIVQGVWSDRWTDMAVGAAASVERMQYVPTEVGNWKMVDDTTDDANPRTLKAAGAVGHLSRTYKNTKTGQTVSLYLVCGHSRKIGGHTPDKCYPASGFKGINQQMRFPLPCGDTTFDFHTKSFRKESIVGTQMLRIFWAWAVDPEWKTPPSPTRAFAGVRGLYKMYLISQETRKGEPDESPCVDFAKVFLPELNKALFPSENSPEQKEGGGGKAAESPTT